MKIKQVIVVRKDLNMRKGKLAAQVAHASMKVFFDRMKDIGKPHNGNYSGMKFSKDCYLYATSFTPEMIEWMEGDFTKIVVGVDSLDQLFELKEWADTLDIPHALIKDNGLTEFKEGCPQCRGKGKLKERNTMEAWTVECGSCEGTGKISKPTITCLVIGPDKSENIDSITKNLKLL